MPALRSFLLLLLAVPALTSALAAARTLDDGKLEVDWFSPGAVFREADEIGYLWVSPGFSLAGKSLHFVPWPEPEFRGPKAGERDEKDHRLAKMMNGEMHELFRKAFAEAFGGDLATSLEAGAIRVEGRIVDCSTGSTAAKVLVGFGAGSGNTTIDLRFVDAASGEVLAGLHHRVVSGTTWSTTDSKFLKWVEEMAGRVADEGLEKLYEKGKKVKD